MLYLKIALGLYLLAGCVSGCYVAACWWLILSDQTDGLRRVRPFTAGKVVKLTLALIYTVACGVIAWPMVVYWEAWEARQ